MSFCISPWCSQRRNPDEAEVCQSCGTPLLINDRIRLIRPLREFVPLIPSEVFEVEDLKGSYAIPPGRRVLKTLRTVDAKRVEMLEREIRALQMLNDPGIPKADLGDFFKFIPNNSGFPLYCILMTKLDGQDLDKWIEENGRISQEKALDWLKQFFQLLHKVHDAGFFHRDIKPSNILLKDDGTLALIDFGGVREVTESFLAKISGTGDATGLEREHEITIVRTPLFSPPEQINGRAIPQSDFYAAGRTFVCLVTGLDLFDIRLDGDNKKLLWREKAPHIDPPLADFIDKLMALSPKKRPKTTEDILDQLDHLPRRIKRYRRFHSKPYQIVAVVLIALVLFGLFQGGRVGASRYFFRLAGENEGEGKLESAKENYERAIWFDPGDQAAYNNLALVCKRLWKYPCALENFDKALELKPHEVTLYNIGSIYDDAQDYKEARQYYEKSIEVGQGNFIAPINNLARLDILEKNYQKAAQDTAKVLGQSEDPQINASLYKNLGWAQFELEQYEKASINLKKSIELQPDEASAHCLLAKTKNKQNYTARSEWESCLFLNSVVPEVWTWKQEFIDRLDKP
ncbi:protein kinase domain-containing protein [Acaryochloris sp. CCMEE 5410]|uniref:serine/threonine-protein kinase n=1 Tax=Acaryochloris sp. CCMEE 5410 TaxID=310037 RepID=UPI0002EE98A6|nr:serine/threonine-protein kinase [Acaryochloris sp. CCMEE 5410]